MQETRGRGLANRIQGDGNAQHIRTEFFARPDPGLGPGRLFLWGFLNPVVARILARIVGVVLIGIGIMWVVAPIADKAAGVQGNYTSPFGQGGFGPALGWGAGSLIAGILALVLSFLQVSTTWAKPVREKPAPSYSEKPEKLEA